MAQNRSLSKYTAALRIGVQKSLEYRFDFFVNILSTLFPILIQLFVWTAIYASGNTAYFGYDYTQMLDTGIRKQTFEIFNFEHGDTGD